MIQSICKMSHKSVYNNNDNNNGGDVERQLNTCNPVKNDLSN